MFKRSYTNSQNKINNVRAQKTAMTNCYQVKRLTARHIATLINRLILTTTMMMMKVVENSVTCSSSRNNNSNRRMRTRRTIFVPLSDTCLVSGADGHDARDKDDDLSLLL